MPLTTQFFDEMRMAFEDNADFGPCWLKRKITYISARENGHVIEWGRRTTYLED